MDITTVFETVIPGSNPGLGTCEFASRRIFAYTQAASQLFGLRQDSKGGACRTATASRGLEYIRTQ